MDNKRLEFIDDVGKTGSKKGPNQFIFGDGTEEGAIKDLLGIDSNVTKLSPDQLTQGRRVLNDSKQFKKVEPVSNNKQLIGLNQLEGKYGELLEKNEGRSKAAVKNRRDRLALDQKITAEQKKQSKI